MEEAIGSKQVGCMQKNVELGFSSSSAVGVCEVFRNENEGAGTYLGAGRSSLKPCLVTAISTFWSMFRTLF